MSFNRSHYRKRTPDYVLLLSIQITSAAIFTDIAIKLPKYILKIPPSNISIILLHFLHIYFLWRAIKGKRSFLGFRFRQEKKILNIEAFFCFFFLFSSYILYEWYIPWKCHFVENTFINKYLVMFNLSSNYTFSFIE